MTSFTGPTCSDESVSYEFGPNRGIITYTYPEDARPEMQEDTIAIGLITTKSDAVLLRIISGTSNDYIEMYIVEGNVFVVYNLGTNDLLLGEISVKVNDNAYHVIRYHRYGHNSTLQVDDYNVQTNHPSGHQLQVFNSQSQIQIGGKWNKKGRIERPFSGVISGVVVNGLRILDLAAEKDVHASIRGDVSLISGILDRQDHLQKMQQKLELGKNLRILEEYSDQLLLQVNVNKTRIVSFSRQTRLEKSRFLYKTKPIDHCLSELNQNRLLDIAYATTRLTSPQHCN
ncbi:hypothetical protein JTB14_007754 [Gonioctena quinquepunctata]|nr:hypothetical protein JTB14_007754 [Gonioctena quinquepunctata]